jgi:hypothetical protein
MGTAFRRLQQRNARGHDYTECADDFHASSYASPPPAANTMIPLARKFTGANRENRVGCGVESLRPPPAREGFRSFLLLDLLFDGEKHQACFSAVLFASLAS